MRLSHTEDNSLGIKGYVSGWKECFRQRPKESMTYSGNCKKFSYLSINQSIHQSIHAISKERNEVEDIKEVPDHMPRPEIWILS